MWAPTAWLLLVDLLVLLLYDSQQFLLLVQESLLLLLLLFDDLQQHLVVQLTLWTRGEREAESQRAKHTNTEQQMLAMCATAAKLG